MAALSPLRHTRRRALALSAGATLAAALPARQAGAQAAGGKLVETEPPVPAAPFSFTDPAGKEHTAADFAGQGLVVNLWATWCPPCVAEMPALDRAQAALAEEGVRVLALSSDREGRAKVEPFYRERGIRHLGLWLDPRGAATRALGARGLPTTVVIDRKGLERARLVGPAEWDKPEMLAAIRRLVGPPPVETKQT
ncbi:MAG: TlpA family protein disulfide reductase [Acetobacteraceae bacterium]|nr:TlpA family protein disulfide reductase [Acetobacteraceae bacterium]